MKKDNKWILWIVGIVVFSLALYLVAFLMPLFLLGGLVSAWYFTKKQPHTQYRNIALILSAVGLVGSIFLTPHLFSNSQNKSIVETSTKVTNIPKETVHIETTVEDTDMFDETTVELIYPDNETINVFLNKFNVINDPNISSDMISKRHIKGSDRDDVVNVSNDKLEISIHGGGPLFKNMFISKTAVFVGYTNTGETNEDFKNQFIKYIKVFDDTLTDKDILELWDRMISENSDSFHTIKQIEVHISVDDEIVRYFKITAKFDF